MTEAGEPTLGDVLDAVGPGVLDVLAAPAGLDAPIGAAVIYDVEESWTGEPGDVLLAVGVDPRRPEGRDLVARAGKVGAAAVVVKRRGDGLEALIDEAEAADVKAFIAGEGKRLSRGAVLGGDIRTGQANGKIQWGKGNEKDARLATAPGAEPLVAVETV